MKDKDFLLNLFWFQTQETLCVYQNVHWLKQSFPVQQEGGSSRIYLPGPPLTTYRMSWLSLHFKIEKNTMIKVIYWFEENFWSN